MRIKNAQDVASWRLCVGCGACSYMCPEKNITLFNVLHDGIRPTINESGCTKCGECLNACPGISMVHSSKSSNNDFIADLMKGWGPILEIWEGHAVDPEIRYCGSSGGVASALALYCIEKEGMHGLLHIGPDDRTPLNNRTVFSTSRSEIVARTGSRYSPASPCDSLDKIVNASGPCVFVGKPCDVTAVRKAQLFRSELDENIGATIGIFCAGTPSLQGTLDLLHTLGIDHNQVERIRYRGKGWPGKFSVQLQNEHMSQNVMTYKDAWGFVQKYRPFSCYLCPDGTSEFADISCGDPWYREIWEEKGGYSLVLVRTESGRQILRGAMKDGYVTLEAAAPKILEDSQKNLLMKRGSIWGRLLALKFLGIPIPRLVGFSLFESWLSLTMGEKIRSIVGTAKRAVQRKYYKTQQ